MRVSGAIRPHPRPLPRAGEGVRPVAVARHQRPHAERPVVLPQRLRRVRIRMQLHLFRRPFSDHQAAGVAAFGPEVDQPVGGPDDVQVVFDDDDRVAVVQQLAQRPHQLGDVVEVQAGGRLVEHEQRAARGNGLPAGRGTLGRLRQEASELQPLRLAARQRRHRLAELHVLEADVDNRLQCADHVAVVGEQRGGLADGEFQHVGDVQGAPAALDADLEDLGPVALAVAVGAAQVDVREELHLDVLEAGAPAGRAAAVAGIEAELGAGVAALPGQRGVGEDLADAVPRADVAHRIGARRLADRRLVDEHDVAQVVGAEQPVVVAGRFAGLAEVPHQCRGHDVLHQRGLARTRDAGDAHQPLQREFHGDVLQVVFARAFQDQPRR